MLVNLGAQMSLRKKGQTAVPHKLMASIVIGRLILMPIVCGCVIFGAVAVGVLPTDRILLLLLLLQGATPTAMSLGTISQMHGQYMDEISEIMFVCVSPPPLLPPPKTFRFLPATGSVGSKLAVGCLGFRVNVISVPFFTIAVACFLALLDPAGGFLESLAGGNATLV